MPHGHAAGLGLSCIAAGMLLAVLLTGCQAPLR